MKLETGLLHLALLACVLYCASPARASMSEPGRLSCPVFQDGLAAALARMDELPELRRVLLELEPELRHGSLTNLRRGLELTVGNGPVNLYNFTDALRAEMGHPNVHALLIAQPVRIRGARSAQLSPNPNERLRSSGAHNVSGFSRSRPGEWFLTVPDAEPLNPNSVATRDESLRRAAALGSLAHEVGHAWLFLTMERMGPTLLRIWPRSLIRALANDVYEIDSQWLDCLQEWFAMLSGFRTQFAAAARLLGPEAPPLRLRTVRTGTDGVERAYVMTAANYADIARQIALDVYVDDPAIRAFVGERSFADVLRLP